jgi:hypothetical protein
VAVLDTVCLVTSPRSGANHLLSLCENLAEAQAFPTLFETLAERLAPEGAIAAAAELTRANGKRVMAFRLWHDMLPLEEAISVVADRPGVRLVLVMRRQIDAYLSWCKAIELGQWQGIDTSELKLRVAIDDFIFFMEAQERWFAHWQTWLTRRYLPLPILRYETDIDQPPEWALKRLSAAAAQVGITLRVPAMLGSTGLVKQDRVKAAADKIGNWPQFSRELTLRGLEKRAFGYPL